MLKNTIIIKHNLDNHHKQNSNKRAKIFLTTNIIERPTNTKHNNIAKFIYKYGQNKR